MVMPRLNIEPTLNNKTCKMDDGKCVYDIIVLQLTTMVNYVSTDHLHVSTTYLISTMYFTYLTTYMVTTQALNIYPLTQVVT